MRSLYAASGVASDADVGPICLARIVSEFTKQLPCGNDPLTKPESVARLSFSPLFVVAKSLQQPEQMKRRIEWSLELAAVN